MRPKRIRTRRASLQALAVLLLAGGCGGGGGESAPPPRGIEPTTAERLAATSESIAELLDQGDVCSAAQRADELRAQVTEAINARAVPTRFHEELSAKANELVNTVNCPPPPEDDDADDAAEEEKKDGEEGEGNGQGNDNDKKDKDKDKDKDEPLVEITPPPIDEERD